MSLDEIKSVIGQFDGIVIRSRFKIDSDFLKNGGGIKFFARVVAISFKPWAPFIPVKVFAFCVFTIIALTKCLLILRFQFMLAEVTFDVVYTAAKFAPS